MSDLQYITTTLALESNSPEFLKTRKFPSRGLLPDIEVNWIEEKEDGDGVLLADEHHTRTFTGYRTEKWNSACTFAFKLVSGFLSSRDKRKDWNMTFEEEDKVGVFSKVIHVVITVNF